jgi:hypothetical protein
MRYIPLHSVLILTGVSAQRRLAVSIPVASLALVAMAAEWMLLVSTTQRHEMIVGALSVLASGAFLWHAHRSEPLRLRFAFRDIVALWRVPGDVLSDVWTVTTILVRDLAGHRAGSFYRVCDFVTVKDDPKFAGRRVLATLSATVSPNLIVIGVDGHQSRMLFHQVERSGLPKMLENLGAKP